MKDFEKDTFVEAYREMVLIRTYEEELQKAYWEGKASKESPFDISAGAVPGEMHLSMGQEPSAVGVNMHLTKDDAVFAPHRPHHIAIAKGVDLKRMTAEIFGKEGGLGNGKGGHMHLFDPSVKFSCGGIEGATWPQATGAALAFKMRKENNVAIAFGGEGAVNQGTFHESLNLASVWKLPVVFVIEDNKWAISVSKKVSTSVEKNSVRAASYNMPGYFVADNDVEELYQVAGKAIEDARNGKGPSLIEFETYRYAGHFEGDAAAYISDEEKESIRKKDPIERVRNKLLSQGWMSKDQDRKIHEETRKQVSDVMEYAKAAKYPEPESTLLNVYRGE